MSSNASTSAHAQELRNGDRYEFGANWSRFLSTLDEDKIREAEESLKQMLELLDLNGLTFLDIGSGSGLFSLAARRLGATVTSFDYDPKSVACAQTLKQRYFPQDSAWTIYEGSVLDRDFMDGLGSFDLVYSWGVLHHTGQLWQALENAARAAHGGSKVFIALYNHQGLASSYWTFVKRIYNKFKFTRPLLFAIHAIYPALPSAALKWLRGQRYGRGMNPWHDLHDWLGGYPFEASTPEEVFNFYKKLGFRLEKLRTVRGKMGCNEFVFQRS